MRWLDDEELSDQIAEWLKADSPFLQALARAAMVASDREYGMLRASLVHVAFLRA